MRIQARTEIPAIVERDGRISAVLHAVNSPAEFEGAGDRVLSNVPLPDGGIIVTGDTPPRGGFAVQTIRWRSRGWEAVVHRVVGIAAPQRFSEITMASPWTPGPWAGDSLLAKDFNPGLPTEANPA